MKNSFENSRRNFLSQSIKGAAIISAGATFTGTLFDATDSAAQSKPDTDFRARIAALGTASLQTSKLALSKATNPQVKLFAQFEAAEQEAMGKILKDMGTAVPSPNPDGKELLANLQKMSGSAFDKEFMQGQVQTHQKLHQAVSAYMNGSNDKNVKHITSLALTTITEHTERGQMLLKQLS
jgi:putative membrane protein